MSFEQHPELFWSIIAVISVAGGYLGATIRDIVRRGRRRAGLRSWGGHTFDEYERRLQRPGK
jgi:hypothetical protein